MLRKINCLFIYCWCYKTTVTSRTIFLLAPGSNVSEEDDYNLNTMQTKLCCWIRRALYFRHTEILSAQIGCQFVSIVLLIFYPLSILIIVWLCWACSLWITFDSPSWNYYLRCIYISYILYIHVHVSITFFRRVKNNPALEILYANQYAKNVILRYRIFPSWRMLAVWKQ